MISVCEIFSGVQGEGQVIGYPSVFVRLSGCNLRCSFCDSKFSWNNSKQYNVNTIVNIINNNYKYYSIVTVTGGEPLLQDIGLLIQKLNNYCVVVETNGSVEPVGDWVDSVWLWSVSLKPGVGGFVWRFRDRPNAYYKFVILKQDDLSVVEGFGLDKSRVFVQPNGLRKNYLEACRELIEWNEGFGFRVVPQLHRILFGFERRK